MKIERAAKAEMESDQKNEETAKAQKNTQHAENSQEGWTNAGNIAKYLYLAKDEDLPHGIDRVELEYNRARDFIRVVNIENERARDSIEVGYIRMKEKYTYTKYVEMVIKQIKEVLEGARVKEIEEAEEKQEEKKEAAILDISDSEIQPMETHIKFSYESTGVLAMKCNWIRISYQCKRCGHLHLKVIGERKDIQKNTQTIVPCEKCTIYIKVETRFHLITVDGGNKNNLMKLETFGVSDLTVRDAVLNCICDVCGSIAAVALGDKHACSCRHVMWIKQSKMEPFKEVVPGKVLPKRQSAQTDISELLKNGGACEHYKKSTRIFIFPCCNGKYPCDICHDQKEGHKGEMARRMVCGKCGMESAVSKTCPNVDCKSSLVRASSQFWEGGKGGRNKATLSRKDSKKYTR